MTRRRWLITCSGGIASLLLAWSVAPASAAPGKVALAIVTQKASALNDLTTRELKRLYLGEQVATPDGKKIVPLNQAAKSPDRVAFEQIVLGMSPDEVSRFWIDRKIRGQPGPPKSVPSVDLLRRVIASLPGTVVYLKTTELNADLKVITIDGKKPGEPGYALQY
jgi:hypothetical protein